MKTTIIIEVDTKFKKITDEEFKEDVTEKAEKEFHRSIFDLIERVTIDNEDFEDAWVELVNDQYEYDYIPVDNWDGFSDYGEIRLSISKEENK